MAVISVKKGDLLFEAGSPVNELYLILKGSFLLRFSCGEYTLSKGEVIGVCELQSDTHRMTCTALEDATIIVYPFSPDTSLEALFQENPDCCTVFVRSAFNQMNILAPHFAQAASGGSGAVLEKYPSVPAGFINAICSGLENMQLSLESLFKAQELSNASAGNAEEEITEDAFPDTDTASCHVDFTASDISTVPHMDPDIILARTVDSLKTILEYAEADSSFSLHFKELLSQYKRCNDKAAADDAVRTLRQQITLQFYELYKKIFFRAVSDTVLPLPVKMFLYFGYVDEELAGKENTVLLGQLTEYLSAHTDDHIYTFYDWLCAIYEGRKMPCRNEFDQDYTDYLHKQKVSGAITPIQAAALAEDGAKKVEYELQNMFPIVNKITYGRISSFCPVFSAHNMLKKPETAFVSISAVKNGINAIRNVDYSAFYREYLYTNETAGIPKESFHTEALPDIILMPNVGVRGIMWQEIEGKYRTTPSRMMLPVFYLEDLYPALVRLTGEYRWEMCKRIQGPRWNDVSDRSLTSEYFDYIQFYKKSHDLSPEAKEKLKLSLQKARGSFKEMFVRDYMTYILYESAGSPRLTRPARSILFTYCPFTGKVRNSLTGNPIYKEVLDYYSLKQAQQLHHLELLIRKLENAGHTLPRELLDEKAFYER